MTGKKKLILALDPDSFVDAFADEFAEYEIAKRIIRVVCVSEEAHTLLLRSGQMNNRAGTLWGKPVVPVKDFTRDEVVILSELE